MTVKHDDEQGRVIAVKSTSERRKGVHQLKLMIDEAHRLREEGRVKDYAGMIVEIDLTYAKLDPMVTSTVAEREKSAEFIRSIPDWHKNPLLRLDEELKSISKILSLFESGLRGSFEFEVTGTEFMIKLI